MYLSIGDFNHVILYEMGLHAQKKQWILYARLLDQMDPPRLRMHVF